jgi:uncharacterized protein (TIGR04551 family)
MPRWLPAVAILLLQLCAPAYAQFGPGSRPPGGGAGPSSGPDKEEGPAEQAPEDKAGESPALQPLPAWPAQREKQLQFFQLNGYIRFRAYLFHNLNMGYFDQLSGPKAAFPIPFSEIGSSGMANPPAGTTNPAASCAARNKSNCREDNITSADMRLRLEPTINVTEQVRVKAQVDVFDNLVLGSTPEGYYLNNSPTAAAIPRDVQFTGSSRTQQAPEAGFNAVWSSIRAKRAWAEVRTPFGELRFGRMPSHWGMGMLVNNGDCLDCDYGVNADRVMFATKLWNHFFAFLWDWVATGATTQNIGIQQGQGVFYNAEPLDDGSQWILALGRMDKPEEIKEKLDQGKTVFNYGGYFVYRQQTWALSANPRTPTNNNATDLQNALVPRGFRAFIGDIWLRLDWKKLHLELEGALIAGKIDSIADQFSGVNGAVDVISGGFAFKGHYKLLHDALKIFLEVGFASGDDAEDVNGQVNFRVANPIPVNNRIGRFTFDPDYHVDLILFRRILGAVSNATYIKPGVSYDIIDNFGARVDIIYAIANRPIGYPGNAYNLGLEIDAALLYKNEEEGFYAGLVYGVLFPFAALSFPGDIYGQQFKNDSGTAQTFQARLYVKF